MSENMIIGLVGNQNAGKTTLFNALTGQNATIGNWPGVTIERKEGYIKGSKDLLLVDTPGVYSLSPYTSEEKVTRSFCLDSAPNLIINIVDATAMERSLYLTTQLMELDCDVIVAMNMADILEKKGITIDFKKLEEELGVSVVRISAKTGEGIDNLISLIKDRKYKKNPKKQIFAPDVEKELLHLQNDLYNELEDKKELRFSAVKLFENDPYYQALSNESTRKEVSELEKTYDMDREQIIADQRYQYVTKLKQNCCIEKRMPESITDKLDKIVLNKYLALPIFLLVIGLMYFLSVGVVGSITSDFIDALFNGSTTIDIFFHEVPFEIEGLGPLLGNAIENAGGSVWASDLLANGIIGGISTVLSFIPQLITLFVCLSVLEATGYMSRIAFFLDALFKKFGLSGKSIIPFIVGTGCSVPGIMTARTVENQKEKEMTAMLVPFIPCNAKLPIMSLLAGVIFPKAAWFVTFFCYLFSLFIILLASIVLKKFFFKKGSDSFISELPEYKLPNAYYVYRDARDKTLDFLERAGTTIFLCTFLVWFFTRFTWAFEYVGPKDSFANIDSMNISASILASIGKGLAYIFIPAFGGHYSWGLTVSALQGLIAKEQVVSSLSVIAGGGNNILASSSPFAFLSTMDANGILTSLSFLCFNLFSIPCISAVSTLRRELGSTKKLVFTMSMELLIAYVISTIIGTIAWACNGFAGVSGL